MTSETGPDGEAITPQQLYDLCLAELDDGRYRCGCCGATWSHDRDAARTPKGWCPNECNIIEVSTSDVAARFGLSQNVLVLQEQDTIEFGAHIRHGGWRLGLLVARNVEKGKGNGRPSKRPRKTSPIDEVSLPKISIVEFARRSGTGDHRVARHFEAWERAHRAGYVPAAAKLVPGQEVELPEDEDGEKWRRFYRSDAEAKVAADVQVDSQSSSDRAVEGGLVDRQARADQARPGRDPGFLERSWNEAIDWLSGSISDLEAAVLDGGWTDTLERRAECLAVTEPLFDRFASLVDFVRHAERDAQRAADEGDEDDEGRHHLDRQSQAEVVVPSAPDPKATKAAIVADPEIARAATSRKASTAKQAAQPEQPQPVEPERRHANYSGPLRTVQRIHSDLLSIQRDARMEEWNQDQRLFVADRLEPDRHTIGMLIDMLRGLDEGDLAKLLQDGEAPS